MTNDERIKAVGNAAFLALVISIISLIISILKNS